MTRGRTYTFDVVTSDHPFWIKTVQETGSDNSFDTGVTNNGASPGTLSFTVPASAPSLLYYQCQYHEPMTGRLTLISAVATPSDVPATAELPRVVLGLGLALLGCVALCGFRLARARSASVKS